MMPIARMPKGTPTPAPIASGNFEGVEVDVEVGVEVELELEDGAADVVGTPVSPVVLVTPALDVDETFSG